MNSFYSIEELKMIGFASIGENVLISRKASIYGADRIQMGSHVRVDDFCVLSGTIIIGNYVHIAAFCTLISGEYRIMMNDFSGLSSRCSIYAASDDYSGRYLTNPTVPKEYTGVYGGDVVIGKHVIIGASSVILPNTTVGTGCAVGSMSLVSKDLDEWGIYGGIPCERIKDRKRNLQELEKKVGMV